MSENAKYYGGTPDYNFYEGDIEGIPERHITAATAKKFDYAIGVSRKDGSKIHIAPYYDKTGKLVSQKIRKASNKEFFTTGKHGNTELFGQKNWKSRNGKRVIITEGEIDCMSVSQVLGNTWPVVSLTCGSGGVEKDIKNNLEFLTAYEEIVLCFDADDAGRDATEKAIALLPPGRVKVVSLPEGYDPNEMLKENRGAALKSAIYEAKLASPDEILHVKDVKDTSANLDNIKVYPYPFDSLSEFLIGQRSGELVLWTSGTGSGKSTILRAVAMDHLTAGRKVGMIMLEESPQETLDDLISIHLKKPVRQIRAQRMMNNLRMSMGRPPIESKLIDDLSDDEYHDARKYLNDTGLFIYDHLGNNAMSNLMSRMEYMATSIGCDVIFLDHITAAATGMMNSDSSFGDSERLIIDDTMKGLRSLVARTGCLIHIVSQLRKTDKAYEEGARITLQDLRGSGSLSSVPNTVIALERNRQDPDPIMANTTKVRLLKDRLTGRAGLCPAALYWDANKHSIVEVDFIQDDSGKIQLDPEFTSLV